MPEACCLALWKREFEIFLQALSLNRMAFLLDLSTLGVLWYICFFFNVWFSEKVTFYLKSGTDTEPFMKQSVSLVLRNRKCGYWKLTEKPELFFHLPPTTNFQLVNLSCPKACNERWGLGTSCQSREGLHNTLWVAPRRLRGVTLKPQVCQLHP